VPERAWAWDPSLGVAHGCFWRPTLPPSTRAWAWELRLQDEIGPLDCGFADFHLRAPEEPGDAPHEDDDERDGADGEDDDS
jgi:hypothetical protein